MDVAETAQQDQPAETPQVRLNLAGWVFWITFALSYFLSRPLTVITLGLYRSGAVVLLLAALLLVSQLALLNGQLLIAVILLAGIIILSGAVNSAPLLQIAGFVRIPLTTYLVYYLVSAYLLTATRVRRVLRLMYFIAVIQLPVLVIQRLTFPFVPERLKFSSIDGLLTSADFGTGTFDGDAPMSFFLIGLTILLLFWDGHRDVVKHRWLLAIWMSLTVLAGNSQIQHFTIIAVWAVYFLAHLRPRTVFALVLGTVILTGALTYLNQVGALTFAPLEHTLARASLVFSDEGQQARIDYFLSGFHARDGAIFYYLQQPIKWLGDGPGAHLNALTRERTIGNWGHVFTFYSEVGLIGWLMSMVVLGLIAFPITFRNGKVLIGTSWVQAMLFFAVLVVSLARYPMNTIAIIFTYCILLVGFRVLEKPVLLRLL